MSNTRIIDNKTYSGKGKEEFLTEGVYHPDLMPSRTAYWSWIDCYKPITSLKKVESKNIGKWLIFVNYTSIDKMWDKIRQATLSGELTHYAKCSTASPNPNSKNHNKHVICVYYEEEDCMEARQKLKKLNITEIYTTQ